MGRLKKCPFCGGKAQIMKMGFPHWVYCEDCGARVQGGTCNEIDSINAWNRRAGTIPPKKCGGCMYLDLGNKLSVGYRCNRPDHFWRTNTAMYKQKFAIACKAFEPKGG